MKILCVQSGNESLDIFEALLNLGYETELYKSDRRYSQVDENEIKTIIECIQKKEITHILSTHLFYNISIGASIAGIKYVSIIWDAPYDKVLTDFGRIENCWFSVFDRADAQRFTDAGLKHIFYQPLAVNQHALRKWMVEGKLEGRYYNDICFIGSLYDQNAYDKELNQIPPMMKNYFDSIFEEAAFRWDGIERIQGKTGNEVVKYLQMILPDFSFHNTFDVEDSYLFENLYLVRKLANIERIGVLNLLAEYFRVTCCTYNSPDVAKLQGVMVTPPVEEGEAFAIMAARSKINLNLSLKWIKGGTPKRVMDIMGAGGFVLSNYCEETAEIFEEDKEIVMFKTPEELVEKVSYYLEHEEERKAIALAGQRKVLAEYNYEKYLSRLFAWVEEWGVRSIFEIINEKTFEKEVAIDKNV